MNKKVLIGIGGLFILIFAVIIVLFLKNKRLPDYNLLNAIPVDASFVLQSDDLLSLLTETIGENEIWEELKNLEKIQRLDSQIDTFISIVSSDTKVYQFLDDKLMSLSFHKFGKKVSPLILFQVEQLSGKRLLNEFLTKKAINAPKQRKYSKVNIFEYHFSESSNIFVAFNKGIFLISENSILVENALRQMDAKSGLMQLKGFVKVNKTAGKNVEGNIYVNLKQIPDAISLLLKNKIGSKIARFTNLGNWSELDINLKNDALLLNGFTYSNDSLNNYLNLFAAQSPVDQDVINILPSNTAILINIGLSEPKQFLSDYTRYLKKIDKFNVQCKKTKEYKNMYSIDIVETLYDLMDEEIALFYTDEQVEQGYALLEVKSGIDTKNELTNYLKSVAKKQGWNYNSLSSVIKIDRETSYEIFNLPLPGILEAAFGDLFRPISNKYFTIIDNFIVFGSSSDALKKVIHSYIRKTTLKYDTDFNEFTDFLSSKSNFFCYTNMFRSPYLIANYLNPSLSSGIIKHVDTFRKFQALAYQFRSGGDMIYNNIFLKYIPEIKKEARTIWESHLDTIMDFKPVFVSNHKTNRKEIFVQDLNNNIYLINSVGRIIWKLRLNEAINSDVYQVDYYKNGKLQLFFSTKNKLHLIDRNGNYVEKYPVTLRSPSTAGVAVFDYEKNRNYRLCIPCQDSKVYLYGLNGSIISGWNFVKTEGDVKNIIQHVRNGSKDYIVFADENRIYLLDRKGDIRVDLESQFQKAIKSKIVFESSSSNTKTRLVTTSKDGLVKYIYFDGKLEERKIDVELSENHYFDYQDVDADGKKDFIFLDKNKLSVFSNRGDKIFFHKFDHDIDLAPVYYQFSNSNRKIGITSRTSGDIFLFNSNGEIYPGFPLKGKTHFSIGFLGQANGHFNLIVGSEHNFLYNYSVN